MYQQHPETILTFLASSSTEMDWYRVTMSHLLPVHISNILGGTQMSCSSKRKALSAVQPTPSLKVASVMRWSMLVPVASVTYKFVVAPLTGRVWKIIWVAVDFFFISDTAYSSRKIPSHILHALNSIAGCKKKKKVQEHKGLHAIQTCLPLKYVAHFEAQNTTASC